MGGRGVNGQKITKRKPQKVEMLAKLNFWVLLKAAQGMVEDEEPNQI